jgi:hypothetical protein
MQTVVLKQNLHDRKGDRQVECPEQGHHNRANNREPNQLSISQDVRRNPKKILHRPVPGIAVPENRIRDSTPVSVCRSRSMPAAENPHAFRQLTSNLTIPRPISTTFRREIPGFSLVQRHIGDALKTTAIPRMTPVA